MWIEKEDGWEVVLHSLMLGRGVAGRMTGPYMYMHQSCSVPPDPVVMSWFSAPTVVVGVVVVGGCD